MKKKALMQDLEEVLKNFSKKHGIECYEQLIGILEIWKQNTIEEIVFKIKGGHNENFFGS